MRYYSRRKFVKQTVTAAVTASLASQFVSPEPLTAQIGTTIEPVPPMDDPRLKSLVARALDSAKSLGARYADVRLTHTRLRDYYSGLNVKDTESITVGVRALVNGYWGFASGPVWTPDEMARLGREAVSQAKVNSVGKERDTFLVPVPVVTDKHWETPIKIDPFTIHPSQVSDMMSGISQYAGRRPNGKGSNLSASFWLQDKAFGSTEGSYFTQRLYRSGGGGSVNFEDTVIRQKGSGAFTSLSPAGVGYELFDEAALRDEIDEILERIRADLLLPAKMIDVGRYDVLMSTSGMSGLVSSSIGAAAQLDRALGYEANAGGTSYLNDPATMLGKYVVGSPLIHVIGDRTSLGGAATVAWDDEGVTPNAFPIVSNGVLVNYQTTREAAAWLREVSGAANLSTESIGCARVPSAMDAPLAHTVNLSMASSKGSADNVTLRTNMKKGIEITTADVSTDFQQLNGYVSTNHGTVYEIMNGKRVARLMNVAIIYRAPELWKS